MRNLVKVFTITFFSSILIVACHKDDKKTTKNHFKVADKIISLSAGSIENWGMDTDTTDNWEYEGYNMDLAFFSTGLTLKTNQYGYLYLTGTGQILYFEILTTNGQGLDVGEYVYDPVADPSATGTFDYSDYTLLWKDNNNQDEWTDIVSGKITVNKNGDNYELTITCKDYDGLDVTGYFKGPLQYYNYEILKKSTGGISKPVNRAKRWTFRPVDQSL